MIYNPFIDAEEKYSKFTLIRLNAIVKVCPINIDVEKFLILASQDIKGLEILVEKLYKSDPKSLDSVLQTVVSRGLETEVVWKIIKKIQFHYEEKCISGLPLISLRNLADFGHLSLSDFQRLAEGWESPTEILFLLMRKFFEISDDQLATVEIVVSLFERIEPTHPVFSRKKIL